MKGTSDKVRTAFAALLVLVLLSFTAAIPVHSHTGPSVDACSVCASGSAPATLTFVPGAPAPAASFGSVIPQEQCAVVVRTVVIPGERGPPLA